MKLNKLNHRPLIIIGGGVGGLACGIELGEKSNIPVLIIDKQKKPGLNNSCGGGISEGIVNKYNIPDKFIQRTSEYQIQSGNKKVKISLKNNAPILTTIKRKDLDGYLYEIAKKYNNISFLLETNVYDVKKTEKGFIIFTLNATGERKNLTCDYLVFADGPHTLAKKFGLGTNIKKSYIAFSGYSNKIYDKAIININDDDWGYEWYFPHVNSTNIGYGTFYDNKHFYTKMIRKYKNKLSHLTSGFVPFGLSKKFYYKRAYIIGDAAGLVNPMTGGGISYAIVSGVLAGKDLQNVILKNKKSKYLINIFFNKYFLWLLFSHIYYSFFFFLYKLKIKNAFFNGVILYFKFMTFLYSFVSHI